MRRRDLRAVAVASALLVLLVLPVTGHARTEVFAGSGVGCCIEFGLRLTVSVDGTSARGAIELPGASFGFTDVKPGTELLGISFATADIIRWGLPVARLLAGVAAGYFGMTASGL